MFACFSLDRERKLRYNDSIIIIVRQSTVATKEKNMKRIFVMLLALLLVCSLAACSKDEGADDGPTDLTVTSNEQYTPASGTYNDRFEYEIINGNEVAIVGFDSDYTPHAITVPSTIEECPVVEIADGAFYQCSQLTAVTVPASVTKIGDMAFAGCLQMTTVTLTDAVALKSIGDYAFAYCDKLTTVAIPASVTHLGAGAFLQCTELTAINIPDVTLDAANNVVGGVTALGDMIFMGCEKLTTVTGGNSLVAIGEYAFCGCKALVSYTVPAGVTTVGAHAFSLCDALTSVSFANTTGWCYLADAANNTYQGIEVTNGAQVVLSLKADWAGLTLVRK